METEVIFLIAATMGRVLSRIFGSKIYELTGEWRSCTMRSFILVFCTHPQISLGTSNQGE
jgi:hypothetical protein